jgi:hypothetical protein
MSEKDNQEMAFPMDRYGNQGMTLRDWFAGQAMAGLCAAPDRHVPEGYVIWVTYVSDKAYKLADAMMEARKR